MLSSLNRTTECGERRGVRRLGFGAVRLAFGVALIVVVAALSATALDVRSAEAADFHCGTIPPPGETWPSGTHIITCGVTIPTDSELTIEPGAVVKFEAGTWIDVNGGSLTGEGTEAEPITFTSINDNSVGEPVGSGFPAPGDWKAIYIDRNGSGNAPGTITLAYSHLR